MFATLFVDPQLCKDFCDFDTECVAYVVSTVDEFCGQLKAVPAAAFDPTVSFIFFSGAWLTLFVLRETSLGAGKDHALWLDYKRLKLTHGQRTSQDPAFCSRYYIFLKGVGPVIPISSKISTTSAPQSSAPAAAPTEIAGVTATTESVAASPSATSPTDPSDDFQGVSNNEIAAIYAEQRNELTANNLEVAAENRQKTQDIQENNQEIASNAAEQSTQQTENNLKVAAENRQETQNIQETNNEVASNAAEQSNELTSNNLEVAAENNQNSQETQIANEEIGQMAEANAAAQQAQDQQNAQDAMKANMAAATEQRAADQAFADSQAQAAQNAVDSANAANMAAAAEQSAADQAFADSQAQAAQNALDSANAANEAAMRDASRNLRSGFVPLPFRKRAFRLWF